MFFTPPGVGHPVASTSGISLASFSSGFNPITTNPTLWLDASVLTGDNIALPTWTSVEGSSHVFSAEGANVANLKVIANGQNGLRIVRFPNNAFFSNPSALSSFISASAFTVYVVGKITTNDLPISGGGSQDRTVFEDVGGYLSICRYNNAPQIGSLIYDNSSNNLTNVAADTAWHVWRTKLTGGVCSFIDGDGPNSTVVSGDVGNLSVSTRLGSNYPVNAFFIGDLGELLIWNRALTSQESSQVRTYLDAKWGIP